MAKKVIPSKHSLPKVADTLRMAGKSCSCPALGASSLPSTVLWCLISLAHARAAKAPWKPASVRRRSGIPKRPPAALPLSATTGGYSTTATAECAAAEHANDELPRRFCDGHSTPSRRPVFRTYICKLVPSMPSELRTQICRPVNTPYTGRNREQSSSFWND